MIGYMLIKKNQLKKRTEIPFIFQVLLSSFQKSPTLKEDEAPEPPAAPVTNQRRSVSISVYFRRRSGPLSEPRSHSEASVRLWGGTRAHPVRVPRAEWGEGAVRRLTRRTRFSASSAGGSLRGGAWGLGGAEEKVLIVTYLWGHIRIRFEWMKNRELQKIKKCMIVNLKTIKIFKKYITLFTFCLILCVGGALCSLATGLFL